MYRWLALCVMGCGLYTGERPPEDPDVHSRVEIYDAPATPWLHRIDLVIVIDNTSTMAPLNDRIVENLAGFASAIEQNAVTVDLVIFAITADPVDRGALLGEPIHLVSIPAGGYRHYFTGELADRLAALAPSFAATTSQPLQQLQNALERDAGFRLGDAGLVVVPITNRDDESPGSVDDYIARVVALAGAADLIRVAVIAAQPTPRLDQFLHLGPSGLWLELGNPDWSPAMLTLAPQSTLGLPCLQEPPAKPRECSSSAIYQGIETLLPACDEGLSNRPCEELRPEPDCPGSELSPHTQWLEWPEVGTHVITQCVVAAP